MTLEPSVEFVDLFIIIFSNVGSGPSGVEGVVGSAGLSLGLLGLLFFPFVWGYIQAITSLELSVRYRHSNGGLGAWSKKLLGGAAALNTTVWLVLMQCSTAAFVSELTVAYANAWAPGTFGTYTQKMGMTMAIIVASFFINYFSLKFATRLFWLFSINAFLAFTCLCVVSVRKGLHFDRFDNPVVSAKSVNYNTFINLLIYNSAGYDASASVIKFVREPRTTVPRAMGAVSVVIAVIYVASLTFPFMATSSPASVWQSGHFVVAARELGGAKLEAWILVACVGTNLQMFASALQCAMFTCQGMAKQGVLHAGLAVATPSGIPRRALCLCAFGSLLFGFLPLLVNLSVEGILFVAIILVEMLCFLRMDSKGSVLAPEGRFARRLLVAPVTVLAVWALVVQDRSTVFGTLCVLVLGAMWSVRSDAKDEEEVAPEATRARIRL